VQHWFESTQEVPWVRHAVLRTHFCWMQVRPVQQPAEVLQVSFSAAQAGFGAQVPLEQIPLQHWPPVEQTSPFGRPPAVQALSSQRIAPQQSALLAQTPSGIMLQPHVPAWQEKEQQSPWAAQESPTAWHPGPGRVFPSEQAESAKRTESSARGAIGFQFMGFPGAR
jgi:hypothetical protein